MKFKKEDLINLVYDDEDVEGMKIVVNSELIDTTRWSHIYRVIFSFDGKFYVTTYSQGATEYQDESAYEYDDDEIECREVVPVTKTIVTYEEKK